MLFKHLPLIHILCLLQKLGQAIILLQNKVVFDGHFKYPVNWDASVIIKLLLHRY